MLDENQRATYDNCSEDELVKARYYAVMDDNTTQVVGFSSAGIISCVSCGFTIALNGSEEFFVGQNLFSMILEDDLPGFMEALTQVKRHRSVRYEMRVCSENRIVRQKWEIRGVYTENGFVEYQATGRVISGDVLTRAQFQDGSVFRKLTEKTPVMIYIFGHSKFIYVNKNFEEKFGYTHAELLTMDFWELVHPDHRESVKRRGLAQLQGAEDLPENSEVKGITKEGEVLWGNIFINVIQMNGEPVGLVGLYDITERKRLEEELEKAHLELELRVHERTTELRKSNQELIMLNQNLNNIVQNMSDGVVLISRQGKVKILNPSFIQAWGSAIKDWEKEIRNNLIIDNNLFVKRMFEDGVSFQDEEFILPSLNGQVHFVASGTPVRDEQGNANRCLVLVRPIEKIHRLVNRFTGAHARFHFTDIITGSTKMLELIEFAKKASLSKSSVLIEGESGTGKEMFAHSIHNGSSRSKGPFVALNCAGIPRDLIGSEMFGYVEGAFTGAKRGGNPGKFELASGGTLFLDEIGDMPFEQQAILLRVIQEQQLNRIGGNQLIPVDVRIICATNKDLWAAVQAGTFRKDLYYRLNVINIKIPPLRERPEDILLLSQYYLRKISPGSSNRDDDFDAAVMNQMVNYDWPGNVRELQNLVEKVVYVGGASSNISEWLHENRLQPMAKHEGSYAQIKGTHIAATRTIRQDREHQKKIFMEQERTQIIELMQKHNGNVSRVANEMGLARSTLYKKMNDYFITD